MYWDAGANQHAEAYGIAGYTPITIKVPKGAVKIVVELSGFKPVEQVLDVRKNQTPSPDAGAGAAHGAAGSAVQRRRRRRRGVDRRRAARDDPELVRAAAGRHQVEVKKAGYKTVHATGSTCRRGSAARATWSWRRAEAPTGTLLVNSDAGGDVYVDGQRKDAAPAIITGLPAGDHVVEVRKDG